MKKGILFTLLLISTATFAQKADKLIKEKNVQRVIKALSSDEMMGRSAMEPERIEKASVYLENEFKAIGLQPLEGLTGYRQTFQKDFIVGNYINVIVDGQSIPQQNIIVVSEKTELNIENNLPVRSISFSAEVPDKNEYFFQKASQFLRDTASSVILVDQEFESIFNEVKLMLHKPQVTGKKTDQIFILGKKSVSNYSIKFGQKIESIKMSNIVGMIKGSTKPDESVIFAGHYDHLGILQAISGDSIANGADDDASGTTAVVELARYFKKVGKNNRTLIFSAFTAEELGGYGSIYFSKQLNPDKVMAMFNIEMIGKLSMWGENAVFMTGFEKSDLGMIVQKNLKGSSYQLYPDPYLEQNLFYRSDNKTLARLGVPAHSFSTDQIPTDSLYHSVDDEFESINIKNMTNIIRIIALGSQSIVDGTDTPTRIAKTAMR